MDTNDKLFENETYDTSINVIGGLKDFSIIMRVIEAYFSNNDSVGELIHKRNEFNIPTEKSRKRIESALVNGFLRFKDDNHKDLLQEICSKNLPLQEKELILLWQFALNNRLFREITSNVFIEVYNSGRTIITKDDIKAYLKECLMQKETYQFKWSEVTIDTLSTKYLNIMSKLGFLSTGRIKSFQNIRPSSEVQIIFLYFAKIYDFNNSDILSNELLPISFIHPDDLKEKLKKLSLKGFFNMNFNGITLNIELIYNYKGVCNVLYN